MYSFLVPMQDAAPAAAQTPHPRKSYKIDSAANFLRSDAEEDPRPQFGENTQWH
jgi:hypothetical protein